MKVLWTGNCTIQCYDQYISRSYRIVYNNDGLIVEDFRDNVWEKVISEKIKLEVFEEAFFDLIVDKEVD